MSDSERNRTMRGTNQTSRPKRSECQKTMLTRDEMSQVKQWSTREEVTVSEFVRRAIRAYGGGDVGPVNRELTVRDVDAELLRSEMGRLGGNVNQISRQMNAQARGTYSMSGYEKQKAFEKFADEFEKLRSSVDNLTEKNRRMCHLVALLFMSGIFDADDTEYVDERTALKKKFSDEFSEGDVAELCYFIDDAIRAQEEYLDKQRTALYELAQEAAERGDTSLVDEIVDNASDGFVHFIAERDAYAERMDSTLDVTPVGGGDANGCE